MEQHNLRQGSQEWHAHRATHRNASDTPAMLGVSQYKNRSDLIREFATGCVDDVDAATQRLFDRGHRFEDLARPLAAQIIGKNLYPVVGSLGAYSASFDGLTMCETIGFEHKTLNAGLRAILDSGGPLPELYTSQMEHQLMVSGAEKILFMASEWDDNDELICERHVWYFPDQELRERIIAGWKQLEDEVAAYVPVDVIPAAVAAPQAQLPAVFVQVSGNLEVRDNLTAFGDALVAYVDRLPKRPESDQDFADLEAACKTLKAAEEALTAAETGALAQASSIDEMRRAVEHYRDVSRNSRLAFEKLVKAEKDNRRAQIVKSGHARLAEHVRSLGKDLGKDLMPDIPADFAGAVRGLKTLASIANAVDTELARAKIEATRMGDRIAQNLALFGGAQAHAFLFPDLRALVIKDGDAVSAIITARIAEHKAAEEKRMEAEREKIRAEEQARAQREAQEAARLEARAKALADLPAVLAPVPEEITRKPAGADLGSPMTQQQVAPDIDDATINIGEISARLGFLVSSEFLASLGFTRINSKGTAKLYRASDFAPICYAIVRHVDGVVRAELTAAA